MRKIMVEQWIEDFMKQERKNRKPVNFRTDVSDRLERMGSVSVSDRFKSLGRR